MTPESDREAVAVSFFVLGVAKKAACQESHWLLRRDGKSISSSFSSPLDCYWLYLCVFVLRLAFSQRPICTRWKQHPRYSRQRSWSHHICLPWMDQPLKRAELEYQAHFHDHPWCSLTRFLASRYFQMAGGCPCWQARPVVWLPWRSVSQTCQTNSNLQGSFAFCCGGEEGAEAGCSNMKTTACSSSLFL